MIMMITTKQDFENLLSDEDSRDEALSELQNLQDFDDRTVTRATEELLDKDNPESDFVTEEIENPYPLHAQRDFKEWLDVVELNAKHTCGNKSIEVRKQEILSKYSIEEIKAGKVVLT